jgi:uncharacterized repeat protein (TIGR01451 family)
MTGNTRRLTRVRCGVASVAVLAATSLAVAASSSGAPATGSADLSVTKTDAKDPVGVGQQIDYTITVTNAGPDTAANVVAVDTLPKGTTFISATANSGTCTAKGSKVTCNLGDLTKGGAYDSNTIRLTVKAPSKSGKITNIVKVSSDTPDPNKANDSASQDTTVTAGPKVPTCMGSDATIVGTNASETLRGTEADDVIFASGGADVIAGLGGKDLICGAAGPDRVKGGDANDRIAGGGGRDRLGGQAGNDVVRGGGRADRLRGGSGNDLLSGGAGNDRCSGGPGNDVEHSC